MTGGEGGVETGCLWSNVVVILSFAPVRGMKGRGVGGAPRSSSGVSGIKMISYNPCA